MSTESFKDTFSRVVKETEGLDEQSRFAYLLFDFLSGVDEGLRSSLMAVGKIADKDLDVAWSRYEKVEPRQALALMYQSAMLHAAQFCQMFMSDFKKCTHDLIAEDARKALEAKAELRKSVAP